MSGFIIVIIVFFMVGLLYLKFSKPVFGNKKYEEAKSLEQQGKYKEACLEYAVAILNGVHAKAECKERIKSLWAKYGPFDYADVLGKIKKEKDCCGEAGYAIAMTIIKEIISDPQSKGAV